MRLSNEIIKDYKFSSKLKMGTELQAKVILLLSESVSRFRATVVSRLVYVPQSFFVVPVVQKPYCTGRESVV